MWLEFVFFFVFSFSSSARSFLLAATGLGQLLLQCGRNELFRLGMIALAQQSGLNMFALLYALYAFQQIVIDALADHRIFPARRRDKGCLVDSSPIVCLSVVLTCSQDAAAPVRVSRWLWL